jgi:hypothetical protein
MPEKETETIKITKSFVAKIDAPGWYRDSQLKGFASGFGNRRAACPKYTPSMQKIEQQTKPLQ